MVRLNVETLPRTIYIHVLVVPELVNEKMVLSRYGSSKDVRKRCINFSESSENVVTCF